MTKTTPVFRLLLVGAIVLAAGGATASLVLPQSLDQLESGAQRIFVGVCTGHAAEIDAHGIPVSVYTFKVTEAVKGGMKKDDEVEVRQFGNDVPNAEGIITRFPGIPRYRLHQEVLLFMPPPSRLGLAAPVGLSQGVFAVGRDSKAKRHIVISPVRRKMLTKGVDPDKYKTDQRFTERERRLIADPPERVELTEFCALVRKIGQERERAGRAAADSRAKSDQ